MNRFDRTLRSLRAERPTSGQDHALAALSFPPRPSRRRLLIATGLTIAVGVGALVLALPSRAEAVTLKQIGEALDSARIWRQRTYRVGGPEEGRLSTEIWQQGKSGRIQFGDDPASLWIIFDGTYRWEFSPAAKTVRKVRQEGISPWVNTLPMLAESIRKERMTKSVTMREVERNGRKRLELTLESYFITGSKKGEQKRYPLKTVWIADPADKLPRELLHYQAVHSDDGRTIRMSLNSRGVIDYPSALPASIFDTSVPNGWKLIDRVKHPLIREVRSSPYGG